MNNFGSVVRIDRSNNPPAKTQGRFSNGGRIQKLIAPARELIQSTNTLKRLLDFLARAQRPRKFERARKLKPKFLEYWRVAIELIKEEILTRYKLSIQVGLQRLRLVEKENLVKPGAELLKPKYGNDSPKGFVPLPDAEIGGCARNDSLIARIN